MAMCRVLSIISAFFLSGCAVETQPRVHMTAEEFVAAFGQEGEAALREIQLEYIPKYTITRQGDELRIEGGIIIGMHEEVRQNLSDRLVRKIVVDSPGGDVHEAMKIGRLIHDHALDIKVVGICASSCASYLFPAARKKFIEPGARVVWHGNRHQKDFREDAICRGQGQLLAGMEREREFFRSIGADEYIARVGQEPVFHGDFTISVQDMQLFGVTDVYAEPDYGSQAFCERLAARTGERLACVAVTPDALAQEEVRRRNGEVCDQNGLLKVKNAAE